MMGGSFYMLYKATVFGLIANTILFAFYWVSYLKYIKDETLFNING